MVDIEKIKEIDEEYFYSNRRKATWKRRGKYDDGNDVSEIIDIGKMEFRNEQTSE